jgi:hypothetical protein
MDHEIKTQLSIISEFWSHEKRRDQEIQSLLGILISWKVTKKFDLMIVETFDLLFWSHEIRPPDPHSK